ncbi:MAG: hypothetical protein CMO55_07100 [Verrucomicrobiales bacterium]|nr:hypothetical protein [Verrucomicrobiales bacterium]
MKPSVLIVINQPETYSESGRSALESFFESLQDRCWVYVSHREIDEVTDTESGVRHLPLRDGVCEIFGNLSLALIILPTVERCFADFEGESSVTKWSEFVVDDSNMEEDLATLERRCVEFLAPRHAFAEEDSGEVLVA